MCDIQLLNDIYKGKIHLTQIINNMKKYIKINSYHWCRKLSIMSIATVQLSKYLYFIKVTCHCI